MENGISLLCKHCTVCFGMQALPIGVMSVLPLKKIFCLFFSCDAVHTDNVSFMPNVGKPWSTEDLAQSVRSSKSKQWGKRQKGMPFLIIIPIPWFPRAPVRQLNNHVSWITGHANRLLKEKTRDMAFHVCTVFCMRANTGNNV